MRHSHVARVFRPGAFSRKAPPLKRQATVPSVAPEACADTAVISSPPWRVRNLSERFLGSTENVGPRNDKEMQTSAKSTCKVAVDVDRVFRPGAFSRQAPPLKRQATTRAQNLPTAAAPTRVAGVAAQSPPFLLGGPVRPLFGGLPAEAPNNARLAAPSGAPHAAWPHAASEIAPSARAVCRLADRAADTLPK